MCRISSIVCFTWQKVTMTRVGLPMLTSSLGFGSMNVQCDLKKQCNNATFKKRSLQKTSKPPGSPSSTWSGWLSCDYVQSVPQTLKHQRYHHGLGMGIEAATVCQSKASMRPNSNRTGLKGLLFLWKKWPEMVGWSNWILGTVNCQLPGPRMSQGFSGCSRPFHLYQNLFNGQDVAPQFVLTRKVGSTDSKTPGFSELSTRSGWSSMHSIQEGSHYENECPGAASWNWWYVDTSHHDSQQANNDHHHHRHQQSQPQRQPQRQPQPHNHTTTQPQPQPQQQQLPKKRKQQRDINTAFWASRHHILGRS